MTDTGTRDTETVVEIQRDIQREVAADDRQEEERAPTAMQAGAREYPVPPFPEQHQAKPGEEAKLEPAPMYDAPFWKGSGKLEGKVALISGGDSGIGRAVAVLFAREGADVALAYLSERKDAEETAAAVKAEGRRVILIEGDVASRDFCREQWREWSTSWRPGYPGQQRRLSGPHGADLFDPSPEHFDETLKTNLYGYFHLAQAAVERMKRGRRLSTRAR